MSFASEFRGPPTIFADGVATNKVRPKTPQPKAKPKKPKVGIEHLSVTDLPTVYNHLAKVADYSDRVGRKRPNCWGMLLCALTAILVRNQGGLTLAQIGTVLGPKVSASNAVWGLQKLIDYGKSERAIHGDLNYTVYKPSTQVVREGGQP
jgi:hypothetical protein